MLLELNEVLLEGERQTLSLMAWSGKQTCLTGGTSEQYARWLNAIMGFVPVTHGFISIDGEPLTPHSASVFRRLVAYAPYRLSSLGEVKIYEPPSVQDVFGLKANRDISISNGILAEEVRRVGADVDDARTQLLAVAVLLDKPILLVDRPPVAALSYLLRQARSGKVVVVVSDEDEMVSASDVVVELSEKNY
jgi:ABC-type thiamine transport system ATPase subunit